MDVPETLKNAFIAKLAGIADYYNKREIKWETNSKITTTIEFPKNSLKYAVIRQYRKPIPHSSRDHVYTISEYKDGKRHGKYMVINHYRRLIKTSEYKNGKICEAVEYYTNGKIKAHKLYNLSGRLHGKHTLNYSDGSRREIKNYKNGRLCGSYEAFHENGTIQIQSMFLNDKQHGLEIHYDNKGIKIKETLYNHGRGKDIKYFDDNKNIIKIVNLSAWIK